jgi:ATP-dependent helicase HepA
MPGILTGESVHVGAFAIVWTEEHRVLGVGKVIRISDGVAAVAYCDVPGEEVPYEIEVPRADVKVVSIPAQTRVFRFDEDNGRWQVGRTISGEDVEFELALPNQVTITAPRHQIQVRWDRPISNPVEFLIRQVTETPFFADARSEFMRAAMQQFAACRGMTALLSSCVELEDYQFNVVARVLEDPVQRYLLADEVGLGKTVEAGIIIRQYLIDSRGANVLVIAPSALVEQWRRELSGRFGLSAHLDVSVFIVSSEDLLEVKERLHEARMLVVDEAHHLSRVANHGGHPLYEVLRPHAASIERLLLLSGTPVLADTTGFLRMLHLLDPVVFPLTDLEGFERRVQSRQLVAEAVASLTPENVLAMESDLDRLGDAFSDDAILQSRIDVLRPIVQALPDEGDSVFLAALADLRVHLAETYKLHRRILRNRRRAVPWATPQRCGLERLTYRSTVLAERHRVLDELRVHLVNADATLSATRELFAYAAHPNGGVPIVARLTLAGVSDSRALALARQADGLAARASADGERLRVTCDTVGRIMRTSRAQVVVFCDATTTAGEVTQALQRAVGWSTEVLQHSLSDDSWQRFLSAPTHARVLVCDAAAEEGLNLHGGHKVALHFDLPASPNRIEQRLGRLDRYGTGEAVQSLAPVCEDDPNELAWLRCLDQGLGVFSSSVASLQYVVEETLREAVSDWCNEGVPGLLRWCDRLAGPAGIVAVEQRRIDQQDMLDAMGETSSRGFTRLQDADGEWRKWRDAFLGFAGNALHFKTRPVPFEGRHADGERVMRLNYVRDMAHETLLSVLEFREHFAGAIDAESRENSRKSMLTHPYAFDRRTVLSREGRERALRIVRCGDPFVDSLRAFCDRDDRGRVSAFWRYVPDYGARDASGCDLWYRFDFRVRASVPAGEGARERALERRAEQHFPQQFYTVWVEAANESITSPPAIATAPYRGAGVGHDYNLNPDRWEQLLGEGSTPWLAEWRRHCEVEAGRARRFVGLHPKLGERKAKAIEALARQHRARVAQLESRLTRLSGASRDDEQAALAQEIELNGEVADGITNPELRVDAVRAVFIASNDPFSK